jgi:hypothetical protein
MSNTTGLGEFGEWPRGSGRCGHDGEGLAEQDKLKAMAATRATVRRSRSQGRMSARVRSRRRGELQWAAVSRRGSGPWLSGAKTPSAGGAWLHDLGRVGRGLDLAEVEHVCGLRLAAYCRVGDFYFERQLVISYICSGYSKWTTRNHIACCVWTLLPFCFADFVQARTDVRLMLKRLRFSGCTSATPIRF